MIFLALYALLGLFETSSIAIESNDWKSDWAVEDNFNISIDTEGYRFPTSIAFVPHPGVNPKDPLYFVTELRGTIKVITNDRTIYTFADNFFSLKPSEELPESAGEVGMAGICLDENNGYIFVTFAYQDSNNILRNNIVRFKTKPGTFSIVPESKTDFSEIFSAEESSNSHQIGPCQVYEKFLYVNVGDANIISKSQNIDSVLGKVLRMTLDGKPTKYNPFYVDNDVKKARNYVWASGVRNPFGLKIIDNRVFITDNGSDADRFLEIHEGRNYLWDGTDWSIGTNPNLVFTPSPCLVQFDHLPGWFKHFPMSYNSSFFLTLGGDPGKKGPGLSGDKSIVTFKYNFKDNKVDTVPKQILRYRGFGNQTIVGLAFGPDGLYFVPLFPGIDGQSRVLKITYDQNNSYPYKLKNESDVKSLLSNKGCTGCHRTSTWGWGNIGPNLEADQMINRIKERLESKNYLDAIEKLNKIDEEPYKSFKDARNVVLSKRGIDKIRAWMVYHLIEPKFDNLESQMPNMKLTRYEAEAIADFLLSQGTANPIASKFYDVLTKYIPTIRYRYLFYSFMLGVMLPLLIITFNRLRK